MPDQLTVAGVPVYRDSAGVLREMPVLPAVSPVMTGTELVTTGNPVPVFCAHAYTYDGSGNLITDTVTDGASTWVRSYTWTTGGQTTDSGWVKQ